MILIWRNLNKNAMKIASKNVFEKEMRGNKAQGIEEWKLEGRRIACAWNRGALRLEYLVNGAKEGELVGCLTGMCDKFMQEYVSIDVKMRIWGLDFSHRYDIILPNLRCELHLAFAESFLCGGRTAAMPQIQKEVSL